MRGVNVKDVKENNKAILYECVRKNGPLTLADLEQYLGTEARAEYEKLLAE